MFDTHTHLNFHTLDGKTEEIIRQANDAGVTHFVVPGTDFSTSQKAVELANTFAKHNVYAAVGIHPHHVFEAQQKGEESYSADIKKIEGLLADKRVVAVGEVGLDRHYYEATKYQNYNVTEEFIKTQQAIFNEHVKLALTHDKTLIIHHREAKKDLLECLAEVWSGSLARRSVIHCCEPDHDLLAYAKEHKLFIGVDGDVTYDKNKQAFIKEVPLDMLVLETDAPFLIPEPHRSKPRDVRGPNVPAYLTLIAEKVAKVKDISVDEVQKATFENAMELFRL